MQQPTNDLQRIETPLLLSMLNAYSADSGRSLTMEESAEHKKMINLLKAEMESRQAQQNYRDD